MLVLTLVLVAAGGALGGRSGMTFALILAFGLNFFSYWYSDRIVLKMYKAREVSESDAPGLHATVRRLASRAGFGVKKLLQIIHKVLRVFKENLDRFAGYVLVLLCLHLVDEGVQLVFSRLPVAPCD